MARLEQGQIASPMRHSYPDLLAARCCKLVVGGLEVGGRLTVETVTSYMPAPVRPPGA